MTTPTAAFTCPDDHRHAARGTCYSHHGCRCTPCRTRATSLLRTRRRLIAYGRWTRGMTDPEHVLGHVQHLRDHKYTYAQIAREAGIEERTLYRIAHGKVTQLQGRIASAILAIQPDLTRLDPQTRLSSRGARRRLQALASVGWPWIEISQQGCVTRTTIYRALTSEQVTFHTHTRIAAAYEQLWSSRPPQNSPQQRAAVTHARNTATARRWLPPLAWDDIDNDVEPPVPEPIDGCVDQIAIDLALAGENVRLTIAERHQVVAGLVRLGRSDSEIAAVTGVSSKTIERDREHLGLESRWDEARRWSA